MLASPATTSHISPSVQMAAEILASGASAASSVAQGSMNLNSHLLQQRPVTMPNPAHHQQQQQQQQPQPPQQPPLYMLQWHEHHASFFQLMEELCQSQAMTDVTVACGDVSLEAHSLILSASSPILRSILEKGGAGVPGRKQTLHFMDMNPSHMQLLLQYMYRGEISVHQSQLAPLMQSAKALQIKGLCSSNADEKIATAPPAPPPTINVPSMSQSTASPQTHVQVPQHPHFEDFSSAKKKRKNEWEDQGDQDHGNIQLTVTSKNGQRRRSKSTKKSSNSLSPNLQCQQASPTSSTNIMEQNHILVPKVELDASVTGTPNKLAGEMGSVMGEDSTTTPTPTPMMADPANQGEEASNGNSSTMENWSEQPTMKVKGHRIPVLPKPLSQMKTTETRSYLSRLIWATNDWKRPQYGNPDTKPIWWPNELLSWSEMKKMGGKKSAGLTNVNYNEIQKNILHEGYKYFGFDPETLWTVTKESGGAELTRTQEKLCHILDTSANSRPALPGDVVGTNGGPSGVPTALRNNSQVTPSGQN